jgi:prepilin-type N-terminal cleavage/methylation domain-containing protein
MKKFHPPSKHGFTLVELLVVIAVIAILSVLAVPAFKGLVGTSGIRGGADAILSAMDLTRNTAIESGANAYLVFPADTFTRFIVLSENATGSTNIVTPRWFKIPTGVQVDFVNNNGLFTTNFASFSANNLPRIDGTNAITPLRAIRYDRFGSIKGTQQLSAELAFHVGEGFNDGTQITFTAPVNGRAIFRAQPLLGKWIPSTNN